MTTARKAIIATLGCKVNQLESAAFGSALEEAGIELVSEKEMADIVILNTCAVTETAGAQSRQKLRKLLRKNPEAKIYLTGCHAEEAAEQLVSMPEVQGREFSLFGNSHKEALAPAVIAGTTSFQPGRIMEKHKISHLPVRRFAGRTRAYLRIQDGCEAFCSYCIVPYTRGPSRSLPLEEVITQAKLLAAAGHKELVLTGIHLGFYGAEFKPPQPLVQLLSTLTDRLPEMRWRISSLEPLEIDTALLRLMSERKAIRPHLHIPLQSGSDTVLARMNRRYSTPQFAQTIAACHAAIDDLSIGIDILAGFPGESEEEFQESLTFVESLDISYLHVFPYSKRPGTPAAEFSDQIPQTEKERRARALRQLGLQKKEAFYTSQLTTVRPVLFEGKRDRDGLLKGVSDNYLDIRMEGPDTLLQKEVLVCLTELRQDHIIGKVAGESNAAKD